MGLSGKLLSAIVVTIAVYVGVQLYKTSDHTIPDRFKDDHYWGAKPWKVGDPVPKDDPTINKFTIKVEDSVLTDLKSRLNRTRFTSSIPGVNFEYGFNSDYLKEVIDYWINKYDWRKEEATLNKYPQFTTQIEGLTIHYYHIKPSVKAAVTKPILMVHGWPSSIVEFQQMISHLTTDSDLNFELIIPSLPGYGWSEASHKPGLSYLHIARIMSKLMTRLSHDRFLFHAGDFGSGIGQCLSVMYSHRVIGLHTTLPTVHYTMKVIAKITLGSQCPSCVYDNPELDYEKMYPVMKHVYHMMTESGYSHIQATRPDTIGSSLSDSPAGLAAYILEKFAIWTNFTHVQRLDGGLTDRFTLDQLLTNVMVYWVTNTFTSASRLYKETLQTMDDLGLHKLVIPAVVPVGMVVAGHEVMPRLPRALMVDDYPNMITYTDMLSVGHFAQQERPDLIAMDIKSFVQAITTMKMKGK